MSYDIENMLEISFNENDDFLKTDYRSNWFEDSETRTSVNTSSTYESDQSITSQRKKRMESCCKV